MVKVCELDGTWYRTCTRESVAFQSRLRRDVPGSVCMRFGSSGELMVESEVRDGVVEVYFIVGTGP